MAGVIDCRMPELGMIVKDNRVCSRSACDWHMFCAAYAAFHASLVKLAHALAAKQLRHSDHLPAQHVTAAPCIPGSTNVYIYP